MPSGSDFALMPNQKARSPARGSNGCDLPVFQSSVTLTVYVNRCAPSCHQIACHKAELINTGS